MPGNDLRLLALDGGGVRGLSALMILQQLMETIDPGNPPKPCDYFDMIGGTSTGGLIAIMLGRLRMSIDDCIDAYLSLSDRIFQKKRHRVTVEGDVQGRFDSDELERAVKEVVVAQGLPENTLLKDASDGACKVFVCATSKETSETVCLTSYQSPRGRSDLLNTIKIWEACRATSAASSFFDAIAVGRYGEGFVDGATGANNPVWEVWNQAQLLFGPQPLEGKIKCLVSIGTGVPSLKPFRDDVFHVGKTLVAIATETEQTAERFRRDKTHLDDSGRYYRFNVDRGLEEVGLEESKKRKEIAAATGRYVGSHGVFKQIQACADNMAGREYFGEYRVEFHLQNVPRVSKFVERPAEMAELERVLLPKRQNYQQKCFVLHGLGGIGKTQLAVEFVSQHQRRFSTVFWLDGRSKDSVIQSIASCASRIPDGQISQSSKTYAAGDTGDINVVVQEVMCWLAREDNNKWLLVFDNVDRDYGRHTSDSNAYDVKQYLSSMNHGSILITTRLAKLEQLGDSGRLGKVTLDQARAILRSRYKGDYDPAKEDRLLSILDGLPLAIAQAAAFLQETGTEPQKYVEFYKQKWKELMESDEWEGAPLQDYPDRSVWTTWTISYETIRETHGAAANLLLLWAFLDRKDLWYGLFITAYEASETVASRLSEWVGSIASDELDFIKAMRTLRNYSLIEEIKESMSYATHPVVHQWAYHFQEASSRVKLARLAVMIVGLAVPSSSTRDYSTLQRRLLPHAQACSSWIEVKEIELYSYSDKEGSSEDQEEDGRSIIYDAIRLLGDLYADQGKLDEAGKMYQRALLGYEKALGAEHTSTLQTVNKLGILYANQGKLALAEQMYERALRGYEKALGAKHTSTLNTVNNLGTLYAYQGKLALAEQMYERALRGREKALGTKHTSTLDTVNNLGNLYKNQGKLALAEQMYERALRDKEKVLGTEHTSTLDTVNNLGNLYKNQGKLALAEQMYERALRGYERALGAEHTSTLNTVHNLGIFYADQGKLALAEQMYERALRGKEKALGTEHISTLEAVNSLGILYKNQGKLALAEQMYERALRGYEKALGIEHTSTLQIINNLGNLYVDQGKLALAEQMYERALRGYEKALGVEHTSTLQTVNNLGILYADQDKLALAEQMYERALRGREKALGAEHTSTLQTVYNLGIFYADQGKLALAEQMYERALRGYEKAWGPDHTSTLSTVNNLGLLYADQGKLVEAEQMYQRALQGYEKAIGLDNITTYVPALNTMINLGLLFERQADLAKARTMFSKVLRGYKQVFGPEHTKSETLRDKLCALDAVVENKAPVEIEERADDLPIGSSHPGINKPPSTSKRHKLFRKLGLRFRS